MVLKSNVTDREMNKFQETQAGEHAVRVIGSGTLDTPDGSDYIGVTYPDNLTEVYTYRSGGAAGSILRTVTVVYAAASKNELTSVSWV